MNKILFTISFLIISYLILHKTIFRSKYQKLIIIINIDTKKPFNTLITQICHTMVTFIDKYNSALLLNWINNSQPKVVLKANTNQLNEIQIKVSKINIRIVCVYNESKCEIMMIGPECKEVIDGITGHLKLY